MVVNVPAELEFHCRKDPRRSAWLDQLPDLIDELAQRWRINLGVPLDIWEPTCSWIAPATLPDGESAVLKLGMPHMEAEHEIAGLRYWDGNPTVRLIEADEGLGAMLLEQCEPGTVLRAQPESEQDVVIAELLRRLWRSPSRPHPFRTLSVLMEYWSKETMADEALWPDAGLVRAGLQLFDELARTATTEVLLATDLHAGNVLRAEREPWLVIDPKPFVGDPAYDATQHLLNCEARLLSDADGTIGRFADLLEVDRERVRLWMFARTAAEPRDNWEDERLQRLVRAVAP